MFQQLMFGGGFQDWFGAQVPPDPSLQVPFSEGSHKLVVDSQGNTYVANYTNNSSYGFIYKINTLGNLVWTKQLSSGYLPEVLVIDSSNYLYVALRAGTITNIYKMDTSGNIIWQKSIDLGGGAGNYTAPMSMCISYNQTYVYLTLDWYQNPSQYSVIMSLNTSDGTANWTKSTSVYLQTTSMCSDNSNNLYLGYSSGTQPGGIAKFDSTGAFVWASYPSPTTQVNIMSLSWDPNSSWVLFAGYSGSTGYFGGCNTSGGYIYSGCYSFTGANSTAYLFSIHYANNYWYVGGQATGLTNTLTQTPLLIRISPYGGFSSRVSWASMLECTSITGEGAVIGIGVNSTGTHVSALTYIQAATINQYRLNYLLKVPITNVVVSPTQTYDYLGQTFKYELYSNYTLTPLSFTTQSTFSITMTNRSPTVATPVYTPSVGSDTFTPEQLYVGSAYVTDANRFIFRYEIPGTAPTTSNNIPGDPIGNQVTKDSSGNIYIAGYGVGDAPNTSYIVKTNSTGTVQWQKKIADMEITQIKYDTVGNKLYVAGTDLNTNYGKYVLIQLDSSGTIIWQRAGQYSVSYMYVTGLVINSGGEPWISGYVNSQNGFMAKYDTNGAIQSQRFIATQQSIDSLQIDSSDNMYAACTNSSTGGTYAVRFASNSSVSRPVLLSNAPDVFLRDVTADSSGNFYAVGYVDIYASERRGFCIKFDSSGTILWQKKIWDSTTAYWNNTVFYRISIANDSTLIIVGAMHDANNVSSGAKTGVIVRMDTSGNQLTVPTFFRAPQFDNSNFYSVTTDSNSIYALGAYQTYISSSNTHPVLAKVSISTSSVGVASSTVADSAIVYNFSSFPHPLNYTYYYNYSSLESATGYTASTPTISIIDTTFNTATSSLSVASDTSLTSMMNFYKYGF